MSEARTGVENAGLSGTSETKVETPEQRKVPKTLREALEPFKAAGRIVASGWIDDVYDRADEFLKEYPHTDETISLEQLENEDAADGVAEMWDTGGERFYSSFVSISDNYMLIIGSIIGDENTQGILVLLESTEAVAVIRQILKNRKEALEKSNEQKRKIEAAYKEHGLDDETITRQRTELLRSLVLK